MKTRPHAHTLAVVCSILFATISYGQTSHLVSFLPTNSDCSSYEQTAWDALKEDLTTLSVTLIGLEVIPANSKADSFLFVFPGRSDTLLAVGQYYEKRNDSTYVWWGNVGQYGDVVALASTPGGRSMYAKIGSSIFFAHPLSNRYNVLVEHRLDSIRWNEACATPMEEGPNPEGCLEIDTCKNVFHVLVLVTDEAMEEIVAMPVNDPTLQPHIPYLYILFGMHTLNFAMYNSGLVGKNFRFSVESFDFSNYYSNPIDILEDHSVLLSNMDASDIAENVRADAYILLTNDRYGNYAGIMGQLGEVTPIGIVSAKNMLGPRYTFAHEIGHWLKGRHNRQSNLGDVPDSSSQCNYGWRIISSNFLPDQYSIMSVMTDSTDFRSLVFSNPRYFGNGSSANAEYISTTFCDLADVYYDDDELEISISGNPTLCEDPVTFTINVDAAGTAVPGQPPFTYLWRLGTGIFTDNPQYTFKSYGDTNNITIDPFVDLSQNSQTNFFLYVCVMSADGVIVNQILQLNRVCLPEEPAETSLVATLSKPEVFIFPNPTSRALFLTSSGFSGNANYTIYTVDGKSISSGQLVLIDSQPASIHINLPNGYYMLQIATDAYSFSHPIIVEN
ncbi:MAG: T9SS type A sorting domain-containing protein [Saprospiraceae bacterium]|nr:T9SS type A sorting domain-containing protein [Saprospiraceae bacterium]